MSEQLMGFYSHTHHHIPTPSHQTIWHCKNSFALWNRTRTTRKLSTIHSNEKWLVFCCLLFRSYKHFYLDFTVITDSLSHSLWTKMFGTRNSFYSIPNQMTDALNRNWNCTKRVYYLNMMIPYLNVNAIIIWNLRFKVRQRVFLSLSRHFQPESVYVSHFFSVLVAKMLKLLRCFRFFVAYFVHKLWKHNECKH